MQKQKIYMKHSKIRCNQPWLYNCVTDVLSCVSDKASLTIAICINGNCTRLSELKIGLIVVMFVGS